MWAVPNPVRIRSRRSVFKWMQCLLVGEMRLSSSNSCGRNVSKGIVNLVLSSLGVTRSSEEGSRWSLLLYSESQLYCARECISAIYTTVLSRRKFKGRQQQWNTLETRRLPVKWDLSQFVFWYIKTNILQFLYIYKL